ncbi:hypothetical protein [Draconibacterium orientale]|uniref:hypothetical protein n=1 Tax=Draconibacterium orientale TaxID=1168034 RepID=UPI002ABD489A|nr:hypothetical protein [Draconibacterium orientale]
MTIGIKYYKASIPVMFKITLISFALLNGLAYLIFTILLKTPFEELFSRNWIILVFVPLTQGIIRPLVDRKGIMTIKNSTNFENLSEKIESILVEKGYREISSDNNSSTFEKISKIKKVTNLHGGKVIIDYSENSMSIVGQKILLNLIESKIK